MAIGNPGIWVIKFRSLDEQFLERVHAVWPQCLSQLSKQSQENTITHSLVILLRKDVKARRLFCFLQNEYIIFGYKDSGNVCEKGRVDIALILDQGGENYLAYECKCLNVTHKNGRKESLAGKYVSEGLVRYVNEKYSENLPVGCMLGYVMDGDTEAAKCKVWKAINNKKQSIELKEGPTSEQPLGDILRFSSRHKRVFNQQEIEVRHALLPFCSQG
ncbi:MAG: hypothetical protein OXC62_01265 [Aestuariivita sp.]|nr:hypothetical protein [Aestuariivita sp.]